jgi:hypothetical protein
LKLLRPLTKPIKGIVTEMSCEEIWRDIPNYIGGKHGARCAPLFSSDPVLLAYRMPQVIGPKLSF